MTTIQEAVEAYRSRVLVEAKLEPSDVHDHGQGASYSFGDQVWRVNEPMPNDDRYVCFAIFEGEDHDPLNDHSPGDVRIYAFPKDPSAPFIRMKYSRLAPGLGGLATRFEYSESGWVSELAAEWSSIVYDDDDIGGTICTKCGYETSVASDDEDDEVEPKFCANCGLSMEAVVAADGGVAA